MKTKPPIWSPYEQGSTGWLKDRCGCLTASRMMDAMDFLKSGKESEKRKRLKIDIVAERMTDTMVSRYVTPAMEWGMEAEQDAKDRYEEETGNLIEPCGFALHGSIPFFGASPDGLIGDDGLVEVKCPTTSTFVQWVWDGEVPEYHIPQMLAQLAVTQRKWCDFFAYDPRVKGRSHQVFLARYEPSKKDIDKVEEAAKTLLAEAEELFDIMTGGEDGATE